MHLSYLTIILSTAVYIRTVYTVHGSFWNIRVVKSISYGKSQLVDYIKYHLLVSKRTYRDALLNKITYSYTIQHQHNYYILVFMCPSWLTFIICITKSITTDSQKSHKDIPLTSSPYQKSLQVIKVLQRPSICLVKMSQKNVLSKMVKNGQNFSEIVKNGQKQ